MVLFGGSIIAGGDILAEAIQNEVAKKNIIVEKPCALNVQEFDEMYQVLDTQQRH